MVNTLAVNIILTKVIRWYGHAKVKMGGQTNVKGKWLWEEEYQNREKGVLEYPRKRMSGSLRGMYCASVIYRL